MYGFIDSVSATSVRGWAYDPDSPEPCRVRASLNGQMLAEGTADLLRRGFDADSSSEIKRGFNLAMKPVGSNQLKNVTVSALIEGQWIDLPKSSRLRKVHQGKKAYQDFDGTGSSKSHMKLEALRLDRIRKGDFSGLSVLDIGCNEGFFCLEALKRGAERVVGLDSSEGRIESARQRVPGAYFLHRRWSQLPDEKFDVVLLLSAIHYEADQKTLLAEIRKRLKPDGVLVLECGIAQVADEMWFKSPGRRMWKSVMRHDGLRRYPTYDMLTRELLAGYAVRPIGRSVDQKGDPVPRFVLHCTAKSPTAILIKAPSGSGKTALSMTLDDAGLPCFRLDPMLRAIVQDERYAWSDLSAKLRGAVDREKRLNLGAVGRVIVELSLEKQFVDILMDEIPREAETFVIEGEALRNPSIFSEIVARLKARNIRPWIMEPGFA